ALPQSRLGKALAYTTELWPGLVAFLDHAAIPVDNNATERALRGIALGRKNHYGSRSERGTRVAALCYTLLESAKLAGVEPAAYLAEATRRAIAPRVHDLELVEPPRASRRNTPASTSPAAVRSRRATTARPHPTTRAAPARTRLERARAGTAGEEPPLRCAARTTAESGSRR